MWVVHGISGFALRGHRSQGVIDIAQCFFSGLGLVIRALPYN